MPDYNFGKIYKLVDNTNGNIYVGSTAVRLLCMRKSGHQTKYNFYLKGKGHYISSFDIVKNKDWDCILIENYPCENNKQLTERENYWIEKIDCINMRKSGGRDMNNNRNWFKEFNKKPDRVKYQKEYNKLYRENEKNWGGLNKIDTTIFS